MSKLKHDFNLLLQNALLELNLEIILNSCNSRKPPRRTESGDTDAKTRSSKRMLQAELNRRWVICIVIARNELNCKWPPRSYSEAHRRSYLTRTPDRTGRHKSPCFKVCTILLGNYLANSPRQQCEAPANQPLAPYNSSAPINDLRSSRFRPLIGVQIRAFLLFPSTSYFHDWREIFLF